MRYRLAAWLCAAGLWTVFTPLAPAQDPGSEADELPELPETRVVAPRPSAEPGQAPVAAPAQSSAGGSQPQPDAYPAGNLPPSDVVTAGRTPQEGRRVASSMTVISRDAIRNSGHTDVAQLLRQSAGLNVIQGGPPGQPASVFMRGANSNHTKVLLDGMPVNDPGNPGRTFDFSFLSIDEVDRIEILRGPQSTLYGSDAMGGVINIITARGEGPPQATASAMGGWYGTSREAGRVSGSTDNVYYSVGGSYYETNGFSAAGRPPGNVEPDGYRNGTASGRVGADLTDNFNVDVSMRYHDTDSEVDLGGFPIIQDDPSSVESENTFVRAQATWTLLDGLWVQKFGGGYVQYDRLSFAPFYGPEGATFYGRNGRADWQNDLLLVDEEFWRVQMTAGMDYLEEQSRNIDVGHTRQDNLAGFSLLSVDVGERLFLTAGGRWDNYSRAGDVFTYRTTGRYEVAEATALHGAIGTGFRQPALEELFTPFGGNPDLRPERSKGWEAGVEQRFDDGRLTIDGTYFRNDFVDLIQFPAPLFVGENVGSALASGVELTSYWRLTDETTAFANYTYTHTRDRDADQRLLRRPRDKWSFGMSRTLPGGRANLTWTALYVGDRLDIRDAGGNSLVADAYWRVDVAGWYRMNDRWRLFARVDNLLDEEYEETVGFRSTDFALYAGAEMTLGPLGSGRR